MATAMKTVDQIADVLKGSGLQTIGAMVFWSLTGVRLEREQFQSAVDLLGLGAAVPRPSKGYALLSEAVRRVSIGRKDVIFRRTGKAWAVVFEKSGRKFEHNHAATLHAIDNEDGSIKIEARDPETGEAFQPATEALSDLIVKIGIEVKERQRYFLTDDLSSMLVTMMHGTARQSLLAALSLRDRSGGLYFVHASKVEQVKQLSALVQEQCPGSQLAVLTLTGDADNLARAAVTARQSITSQLVEIRSEIGEFVAKMKATDGKVQDRNIEVRAARFQALRDRADLFADLLGEVAGELRAQIDTARDELLKELEAL